MHALKPHATGSRASLELYVRVCNLQDRTAAVKSPGNSGRPLPPPVQDARGRPADPGARGQARAKMNFEMDADP